MSLWPIGHGRDNEEKDPKVCQCFLVLKTGPCTCDSMAAVIPRPASLRNNGIKFMGRVIVSGCIVSFATSVAVYQWIFVPRQKRTRDFFENADVYKMLERMCSKNVLHSCPENIKKMRAENGN
uniref:COX6C domain-containing protein n=1 Tax=Trichuris muris TaxID=70415 RepID=A0A5S6QAZ6_TRIMR